MYITCLWWDRWASTCYLLVVVQVASTCTKHAGGGAGGLARVPAGGLAGVLAHLTWDHLANLTSIVGAHGTAKIKVLSLSPVNVHHSS